MSTERSRSELADALYAIPALRDSEDRRTLDEAAELLRQGERTDEQSERGEGTEGWVGHGRTGLEFAEDDGDFTPGPKSRRATLYLHPQESPSDG